jgi:hypothetical protein
MQIYHEAPLSIFEKVQQVTDGDYALVHLLDKEPAYAARFIEAKALGRHIILDNSAFELGESFDPEVLAEWVDKLQPDIYVVPDKLGSTEETLDMFHDWTKKYSSLPGKRMGVLQGQTANEQINCFKTLRNLGAEIIGIPHRMGANGAGPKFDMFTRISLVRLIEMLCDEHPIHLLGVALPQEGQYHKKGWVVSVDSSNPVVHGMFNIRYTEDGLEEKKKDLLADMIHKRVGFEQEEVIFYNIDKFRGFWI